MRRLKSHVTGPSVPSHWAPRTTSYPASGMTKRSVLNTSPWTENVTWCKTSGQVIRSPLATVAVMRGRAEIGSPVRRDADSEMKLCEEPESKSAENQMLPMVTPMWRVSMKRTPARAEREKHGVAVVAQTMAEREEFLADVRHRLEQAQAIQKRYYDKAHRHVSYAVGDWVLLRLRQRLVASISQAPRSKLQPRFFGSYRVTELINEVAIRLELPPRAKLHDVFHVGLLKKWVGEPPATPPPLPVVHHGAIDPEPERAVRTRIARGVRQVLIRWKGEPVASSTWEDLDAFSAKYPAFQLEDELVIEGGEMSCTVSPTPGDVAPVTYAGRPSVQHRRRLPKPTSRRIRQKKISSLLFRRRLLLSVRGYLAYYLGKD